MWGEAGLCERCGCVGGQTAVSRGGSGSPEAQMGLILRFAEANKPGPLKTPVEGFVLKCHRDAASGPVAAVGTPRYGRISLFRPPAAAQDIITA